ncbi:MULTISPECIES: hypothetical protein [Streptomyces]|uniref:hypothetical protein n=1 Tax=Streptomyces TaxID=1883 RepID=UPI001318FA03|nr:MULTISPECIES: hypothetical protein [Streptomyces]QGZ48054.1 hypothetical protein GPZ77_06320 [Streptomyces sp. QHH-9511]GGT76734.1 hypothetical protein GCM10010272_20330 [Streptomyces lateritius]
MILRTSARLRGEPWRELLEETLRQCPAATLDGVLASGDRAVRRLTHRVAVGAAELAGRPGVTAGA